VIDQLGFLTGIFEGDGFVIQFEEPRGSMLFGSMQALEEGKTVSWETLRFFADGAGLGFEAAQMGQSAGSYRVTHLRNAPPGVILDNPGIALRSRLEFLLDDSGTVMTLAVEGVREGEAYRREWMAGRSV
jgi:hypothetical protein